MKTIRLGDLLTEDQIKAALRIKEDVGGTTLGECVSRIQREVIEPNLAEINRKTGQENDDRYLAWVVAYAMSGTIS